MHHEGMGTNAIALPLLNLLYKVIAAASKARCMRQSNLLYPHHITLSTLLSSSQNLVNLAGASLSRRELALIAGSLQSH